MTQRLYRIALCALLSACASSPSEIENKPPAQALELSLARPDGRRIQLSELDGAPRLLFLFATYDQTSQFALVPLSRYLEQHPHVQVLGVLLQPDAQTFIPLFAHSLPVPFDLFAEPDNQLLHGSTPLGKLAGVPAFVALDARGVIRDLQYGVISESALEAMLATAQ